MRSTSNQSPELLLDHVAWIRELAKHLVTDESARDDLVQETCVRALERAPNDVGRIRQWLAAVMRNLVHQRARGDARRQTREEQTARAEALEPAAGLVQKVAVQRELVDTVLRMDEPYRSSLLMRYFEEQPPQEIARRLGVPVATVHSRLKRALAQLRERLDDAHSGDRQAWLLAFVPLAESSKSSAAAVSPLVGAILVNIKIVLAVLVAIVIGTVATIVNSPAGVDVASAPEAVSAVRSRDPDQPRLDDPTYVYRSAAESDRASIAPAPSAAVSAPTSPELQSAGEQRRVRGQVLDATGHPISGIPVRLQSDGASALSGPGGHFEIETTSNVSTTGMRVEAVSSEWVTVREGVHRPGSFDPIVIVARSVVLGGEVRSSEGRRLAGVRVSLRLPADFETRFGEILDSSHTKSWQARTDANGRFELNQLPGIDGNQLRVVLEGYQTIDRVAPAVTDLGLAFVLERPKRPVHGALEGRVVLPDGRPVEGARVATGLTSTTTDGEGLFALDLSRAVTPEELSAVFEGYLPATLARPFAADAENGGWPDFVELVLGGPPLVLRGRVVREGGAPAAGVRVWLEDTSPFGTIGLMPTSLENLMAGAVVPPEAIESKLALPSADGDSVWGFTTGGTPSTAVWYYKTTDGEGAFEFPGLFDQTYRVRVLDNKTLQSFTSTAVRPGIEALIEMPALEMYAAVAGRVLDHRGRPVQDVRVSLRCDPFALTSRVFGGTASITMCVNREEDLTDADGRFEFTDVPRSDIRMIFLSDEIVPYDRWLEPDEDDSESLEIRVDVRCHIQVELSSPDLADRFRLRDADGNPLGVHVLSEGSHNVSTEGELVGGRSRVVSVSARAVKLQLLRSGVVVETVALDLWPGEVNVIRSR